MSWSAQQLQAMEVRDRHVLVAAAAGSGKTSVLVERIIRRLLDPRQPLDIDKLLVVTFTNAAATEMRSRIGVALSEALKSQPQNRHIERQLALLGSSSISTIHAFCQSIVRQNFHLLDLDPQFRIANEAEIGLLKADILESLFEKKYGEEEEAFLRFVEHYGNEHQDDGLYQLIFALYDFSRSHPWPEYWLEHLPDAFFLAEGLAVDDTVWSQILRTKILLELEDCAAVLATLSREAGQVGNPAVYQDTFAADQVLVQALTAAAGESWSKLAQALAVCEFAKLPAAGKECSPEAKAYFQKRRQKVKNRVKFWQENYFAQPEAAVLADMRATAPQVAAMASLAVEFGREYSAAKRVKALVDFNDLEHFCLHILLDPASEPTAWQPSPVALALRDKFAEIMVDEYQDTNQVQETIIQLLARTEPPNLFLVGDVKQSIYRFRLAEPALFLEKYRRYPTLPADCRRVDLSENFRSRPEVLHAINFLFSQLMTPRAMELEYGEAEKLNPGSVYPDCSQPTLAGRVELCLIDRQELSTDGADWPGTEEDTAESDRPAADPTLTVEQELSGFELEARLIARRVGELMAAGLQVYDKAAKQYRPLAWRDIVILLRSVQGKAGVLQEQLRQAGMPVYAEIDGGYFRETEVQVMLSLLNVIDNPRQDIHLAGVLRSPLAGFTAGELAELRLLKPAGDLWEALAVVNSDVQPEKASNISREMVEKAQAFILQLESWRDFSRCKGVPELIWQVYRDSGYYEYAGAMPGGVLRQANLRALYDRARQYETTNFRGLFRFLRFVDRMRDRGTDLAVARALGESEDVIRIMSIHKSKGLEFPMVFVVDLGKNFNLQDSREPVLCHKALGVGPCVIDPELRYRYPSLARQAIAYQLSMETKAEELRVLYVALTRARERLILVGSADKLKEKISEWCQAVEGSGGNWPLPAALTAVAKGYLDWIGPALIRHPDSAPLRQYASAEGATDVTYLQDSSTWKVYVYSREQFAPSGPDRSAACPLLAQVQKLEAVETGGDTAWVERLLGWRYPYQQVLGKPAKLSVSEIKRRFEAEAESADAQPLVMAELPVVRPRFMQAAGRMTAVEAGTLLHTVMQQLDLAAGLDPDGITKQVAGLVRRELLLPEQAATVNVSAIAGFFATTLGRRMLASPRIRRELPFSRMIPAQRFFSDTEQEYVFVQGVIDVLFDETDGLVLLDYKTDRRPDSRILADKYGIQLQLYAEAVEAILHQRVKEKYLYLLSSGEIVRVE